MNCKLGEVNINRYGNKMTIIKYLNWGDIDVQFSDGYISKNKQYNQFKRGTIKNPYDRSVHGVGFLGEGEYVVRKDGILTKEYRTWNSMFERSYSENVHVKFPSYKDCTVDDEWHNFQNFAKWHHENYYEIESDSMQLDKDLLIKGNEVYSPETCIYVPKKINTLITHRNRVYRGKFPIGVTYIKSKDKFQSQCNSYHNKKKNLGYFKTPIEAFQAYKKYKEELIKLVANDHKDLIPIELYEALINYEVEITD